MIRRILAGAAVTAALVLTAAPAAMADLAPIGVQPIAPSSYGKA
jgi:hypothetical protein